MRARGGLQGERDAGGRECADAMSDVQGVHGRPGLRDQRVPTLAESGVQRVQDNMQYNAERVHL